MKKLFFKRHFLFFITVTVLVFCQALILRNCFQLYRNKVMQQQSVSALANTLTVKRAKLPPNHIDMERQMRVDLSQYRRFILETWPKMSEFGRANDVRPLPPNHVAMFFEISDYLTWAKESSDSLGVEYDPACSFGFKDFFERSEQPLTSEICDIFMQKEHLKLILSYLFEARSSYLKIISVERGDVSHSAYFSSNDVFTPEIRQVSGAKSYVYRIKFTTFTNSFRNFLRALYNGEIPVIFRQISVQPNHTFKLTRLSPSQVLECLASTFSITMEVLDFPQSFSKHGKKNAALQRKILYGSSQ